MFGLTRTMRVILVIGIVAIVIALSGFQIDGFAVLPAGVPSIRCGVDLPACPPGSYCFNGQCASQDPPGLPCNELPVLPIGAINGRL
jgi:hypothetical protein